MYPLPCHLGPTIVVIFPLCFPYVASDMTDQGGQSKAVQVAKAAEAEEETVFGFFGENLAIWAYFGFFLANFGFF
jgi:hypothetical protein